MQLIYEIIFDTLAWKTEQNNKKNVIQENFKIKRNLFWKPTNLYDNSLKTTVDFPIIIKQNRYANFLICCVISATQFVYTLALSALNDFLEVCLYMPYFPCAWKYFHNIYHKNYKIV